MINKSTQLRSQSKSTVIQGIANTLKTDVTDVLRFNLHELKGLDQETAYQSILDQPGILDAGFRFFRSRPDLFQAVTVDADARPVTSDALPLRCGRSIADVIALVLRAAAKRYFRRKLGRPVVRHLPSSLGLVQRLKVWAGLMPPPKPAKATTADRLFISICDFLVYEWQALMIPVYCSLTPEFVTSLGSHLLSFRDPAQLLAMAQAPDYMRKGLEGKPLLLDTANRLVNKGKVETINSEILFRVVQLMRLDSLFPTENRAALSRQALARIAITSPDAIYLLMPVLGHDIRHFVTFLFVAYLTLGDVAYTQILGKGSNCRRVTEMLGQIGTLPQPTLAEMQPHFERLVSLL